jgi:hypothetical protein
MPDAKTAVQKYQSWGETLTEDQFSEIVQTGSIAVLSQTQRTSYLWHLAKNLGLDPLTKPFDLIPNRDGKLIIYTNRGAADQLRIKHKLTDEITYADHPSMGGKVREDIYEVHVRLTDPETKRTGEGIGCVGTDGLSGEAYADAKMKAHTKALRRTTLAFLGLGMPDETEVGSIAAPSPETVDVSKPVGPKMLKALPVATPPVKIENK